EAAVLGEHVLTEFVPDCGKADCSGFDDLAGEDVRVDQWRAQRLEDIGDDGLTAGDAAGEADLQHCFFAVDGKPRVLLRPTPVPIGRRTSAPKHFADGKSTIAQHFRSQSVPTGKLRPAHCRLKPMSARAPTTRHALLVT